MSSAYVLVAFAVCILLMILFISKWKIHPVTSILVATIILAISIGTPWDKIEGIINKGMADTLKSIAIVIVLGCILGKVLEETGAAVSITKAITAPAHRLLRPAGAPVSSETAPPASPAVRKVVTVIATIDAQ